MLIAVLAVSALALLAGLPSVAAAKTEVRTIPATVVFENKENPKDPGNCSAAAFAMWQEPPATVEAFPTAWTVYWKFKGVEQPAISTKPPFDDVFNFVAEYRVPGGYHWVSLGTPSHRDGPQPNDCSDMREKSEQVVDRVARVEITVELPEPKVDPKKCKAARAGLRARNKAVGKLLGKLRRASTDDAKDRIREQLSKAKASRAKAAQRMTKVCTEGSSS